MTTKVRALLDRVDYDHTVDEAAFAKAVDFLKQQVKDYPCILCARGNPDGFNLFVPSFEFCQEMPAGEPSPGKLRLCANMLCRVCAEKHTDEELNFDINKRLLTPGRCHALVMDIGRLDLSYA